MIPTSSVHQKLKTEIITASSRPVNVQPGTNQTKLQEIMKGRNCRHLSEHIHEERTHDLVVSEKWILLAMIILQNLKQLAHKYMLLYIKSYKKGDY